MELAHPRLVEFTSSGVVLLFVTKKANAEELANNLKQEGTYLGLLHGDMDQSERNKVISDFKKKDIPVLVGYRRCRQGVRFPSNPWFLCCMGCSVWLCRPVISEEAS